MGVPADRALIVAATTTIRVEISVGSGIDLVRTTEVVCTTMANCRDGDPTARVRVADAGRRVGPKGAI
jgi:hypothetical protein